MTRYVRYKHEQIAWSFQLGFFLIVHHAKRWGRKDLNRVKNGTGQQDRRRSNSHRSDRKVTRNCPQDRRVFPTLVVDHHFTQQD